MSDFTPMVPNHTAWFAIKFPVMYTEAYSQALAERYLYSAGGVTHVERTEEGVVVTVRIEAYGDTTRAQLANRVQMQADRFSSGLYPVSEAVIR